MNSKEIVVRRIKSLEANLQHYTMIKKDEVQARFIAFQLEEYRIILQDLDQIEQLEKLVWKKVEELVNEEHRANELYDKNIELKQKNKKLKEKVDEIKQAISIMKAKLVPILLLQEVNTLEEYNEGLDDCDEYRLTQEEFDLLKQVFESVGDSDE